MNRVCIFIFIFILLPILSWGACTNNGDGTFTTSGNEYTDVNDCVNMAAAGNTINVVSGDGAATWPASAVTIPANKPLKIMGPGRDNLTITLAGNYAFVVQPYVGTTELPATRISGFSFVSPVITGTHTASASSSTILTDDTKSWITNRLYSGYSTITNVSKSAHCQMSSNSTTTATCTGGLKLISDGVTIRQWEQGDQYEISNLRYGAIFIQGSGWRVDSITYNNIESDNVVGSTSSGVVTSSSSTTIETTGVVDSSIFINGKVVHLGWGSFQKASNIWSAAPTLGGVGNVIIEDNVFTSSKTERKQFADTNYGGRYVFRYNTINNGWLEVHSLQDDDIRAARHWEFYGNKFNATASGNGIGVQAGTGFIFNNHILPNGGSGSFLLYCLRTESIEGNAGMCNGSSEWDGNQDATGYRCRDQIGAGTDDTTWNSYTVSAYDNDGSGKVRLTTSTPHNLLVTDKAFMIYGSFNGKYTITAVGESTIDIDLVYSAAIDNAGGYGSVLGHPSVQSSAPVYGWGNLDGANIKPISIDAASTDHIKEARDVFMQRTAAFDGTIESVGTDSGVGCGTLANRPTTCTTGVGYWATSQSCSDLTGMVGVAPQTPIAGTLYKCTATDIWESYYTPYTYPHPLRDGDPPPANQYTLTITKSGTGAGTVTSAPAGINCGATCIYNYDENTEVTLTAIPTGSNVFAGWSGAGGCTGTSTCVLAMTEAKAATATFNLPAAVTPVAAISGGRVSGGVLR